MQAARSNRVRLGENLNPVEDATGIDAVDFSADIDNLIGKLDKLTDLIALTTGEIIYQHLQGMVTLTITLKTEFQNLMMTMPYQKLECTGFH